MSWRLPNIKDNPNRRLGLKDRYIGEHKYGIIMEVPEREANMDVGKMVCINCKYFNNGYCRLCAKCPDMIGSFQYFKK
jgi:hypothetical protein